MEEETCSNLFNASLRTFARDVLRLDLSPLVAAIMDASEARVVSTIDDATSTKHFGCVRDLLPTEQPRTVVVRAGGRGGKTSRLGAPKALHAAMTTPAPLLSPGEDAYVVIVAPTMRLARQTMAFCRGYAEDSETLREAIVGAVTIDSLRLRRPDGTIARIEVFAAGRGGAQLRAKTLLGAIFDEAAFFRDAGTGVVNDAELYRAVLQRIVPGGQAWLVSTPWVAGAGLIEEFIAKDWGTHSHALCAIAATRALNPNWDPTGEVERDLREQDPDAAEREIDAVPLSSGSTTFFAFQAIEDAINEDRSQTLPKREGATYAIGADFAFKRDSSALVVIERTIFQKPQPDGSTKPVDVYRLANLDELRPSGSPLTAGGVLDHFESIIATYGVRTIVADSHERDQVIAEALARNINVVQAPEGQAGKADSYALARKLLHEGRLELPNNPRLIRQLRNVIAKPAPGGGITISSPRSTAGGGHGDIVSALVLAVWRAVRNAEPVAAAGRAIAVQPNVRDVWGGADPRSDPFAAQAQRRDPKPGDRPRPRGIPPKGGGIWG